MCTTHCVVCATNFVTYKVKNESQTLLVLARGTSLAFLFTSANARLGACVFTPTPLDSLCFLGFTFNLMKLNS